MTEKHCILCKKEIHPEAKKCPHCLSWQSKWLSDMQNPKTGFLYMLGIFVLTIAILATFDAYESFTENDKSNKTTSSESTYKVIEVLKTEANYYKCEEFNCIVITGELNNPSNKFWTSIYFHVEYFDSNNNLIDNYSEKESDLLIPKNSKTSFKLANRAYKNKEAYNSHKVTIRYASGY